MKRRLEIARGLIHYPDVLFLDEPTIGLDPQTRALLWDYVLKLKHDRAMTIFMTTHYMDEAEYCDRIAIMDHGKIVALDTPANLKKQLGGDIIRIYVAPPPPGVMIDSGPPNAERGVGGRGWAAQEGMGAEVRHAGAPGGKLPAIRSDRWREVPAAFAPGDPHQGRGGGVA
jgi:energy-coupling factor transporter ATP-binding protein EcfA2